MVRVCHPSPPLSRRRGATGRCRCKRQPLVRVRVVAGLGGRGDELAFAPGDREAELVGGAEAVDDEHAGEEGACAGVVMRDGVEAEGRFRGYGGLFSSKAVIGSVKLLKMSILKAMVSQCY